MKRRQLGLATMEFAIISIPAFMVLFSAIEIGRLLWVLNTVSEGTRRAARLAAVCPVDGTAADQIRRAAILASSGTSSPYVGGLTTGKIAISYLDSTGTATTVPANMVYVSVSVSGFSTALAIPFIDWTVTVPSSTATVPLENKGYIPATDTTVCQSL